ncbi:type II toxin-antitoxin system RelE/ParE family toxin (plasmid) [Mycetohabitans endofungorum]
MGRNTHARSADQPPAVSLEDPRSIGKILTGPLGSFWRYRVGDYRVICKIQDSALCVLVVQIGNRREVYR